MINVSILTLKNAVLASIADTAYVFNTVNEILEKSGKSLLFKVNLVGLDTHLDLNYGLFSIKPNLLINEVRQTDIIIIPSMSGDVLAAT